MAWGKRLKHDYIAEVSAGRDETIAAISSTLYQEWDLATQPESPDSSKYVSRTQKPSFHRTILKAIPAHIEWEIATTDSHTSEVRMNFRLPLRLHLSMYVVILIYFVAFNFVAIHVRSSISDHTVSWIVPWSAVCLIDVFFLAVFLKTVFQLLLKFRASAERLICRVAKRASVQSKSVSHLLEAKVTFPHRLFIDWKLCFFLLVLIYLQFRTGVFGEATNPGVHELFSSSGLMVLAPVVILSILVAMCSILIACLGSFLGKQLLPSGANLFLVLGLFFCLIAIPASQEAVLQGGLLRMGRGDVILSEHGPRFVKFNLEYDSWRNSWSRNRAAETAKYTVFGMYVVPLFCLIGAACMWSGSFRTYSRDANSRVSKYEKFMVESHKHRPEPDSGLLSRTASIAIGLLAWLLFLGLAAICWSGVFLNLSLLCAVIDPSLFSRYLSDGAVVVKGAQTLVEEFLQGGRVEMVSSILGLPGSSLETASAVLGKLIVIPVLFPFGVFVLLHAHCWIDQWRRRSSLCLGGELAAKVQCIAKSRNIEKVFCVLDEDHREVSPYAEVRGLIPRKRIVFGPETLRFFAKYPEYVEPVIAHEVGHIERHCHRIRRLNIISRVGLVGAGFLAMTLDSIKIEREADEIARDYLVSAMKDKADDVVREDLREEKAADLIGQAACAMVIWRYKESGYSKKSKAPRAAAFDSEKPSHSDETHDRNRSVLQSVKDSFEAAFHFYFELELYHYLHQDARLRRIKLLGETR